MIISEKLLVKIAKLSRIELSKDERKKFIKQLNDVLDAFKKIEEVDVEGITPSFQPVELKNVMREDIPKKFRWEPLSNVIEENREDGYIKGPKIMERL